MRKTYADAFKFKVALEALSGNSTIAEICREHDVSQSLVHKWRNELKAGGPEVFKGANKQQNQSAKAEREREKLYEQIGRLKVEVDFLKKNLSLL